jgi:hypothetical protein
VDEGLGEKTIAKRAGIFDAEQRISVANFLRSILEEHTLAYGSLGTAMDWTGGAPEWNLLLMHLTHQTSGGRVG